jgi:hypothetical protein
MKGAGKSRSFRGVYIAGAVLLCAAVFFALRMGFSYDGKCGGFLPEVSTPRPCSLWSYMTGDVLAIAVIVGLTYWPLLMMLIVVAVLLGYFLSRRGKHGGPL